MHGWNSIRIALLGAALALPLPASADAELDEMVRDHVMPRFDQQARHFIKKTGARFVSSGWNGDTRTLIAVAELEHSLPLGTFDVALARQSKPSSRDLKRDHVAEICRHPMLNLIARFLEKYDVTMSLVYGGRDDRADPHVVEISHTDLRACV